MKKQKSAKKVTKPSTKSDNILVTPLGKATIFFILSAFSTVFATVAFSQYATNLPLVQSSGITTIIAIWAINREKFNRDIPSLITLFGASQLGVTISILLLAATRFLSINLPA